MYAEYLWAICFMVADRPLMQVPVAVVYMGAFVADWL